MFLEDGSSMELSLPFNKFLFCVQAMPMDIQKLFNEGKTKFILIKRAKGYLEIKNLKKHSA
jgi:hypothetical protein